jgi:hypothetical protein
MTLSLPREKGVEGLTTTLHVSLRMWRGTLAPLSPATIGVSACACVCVCVCVCNIYVSISVHICRGKLYIYTYIYV